MKKSIKSVLLLVIVVLGVSILGEARGQQNGFNRAAYYKLMENGKLDAVDAGLKTIENSSNINKDAYAGALLMKKAGLVKGPAKKLGVFKDGHSRLEAAIEKDNSNAEWHFLRLIIQEHAPGILNYKADIDKDAGIVQNNFKNFSPELKAAVMDYRKQSNSLQKLSF